MEVENISLRTDTKALRQDVNELKAKFDSFMLQIYPVGCIYMSIQNISPNTLFGGTWERWGVGRFPLGVDESDERGKWDSVEMTGGQYDVTLTVNQMPKHKHTINTANGQGSMQWGYMFTYDGHNSAYNGELSYAGNNEAHNNMPPYITCYMWKRVA